MGSHFTVCCSTTSPCPRHHDAQHQEVPVVQPPEEGTMEEEA